ncbi:NifZ family protein, partial [Acidithiobacillus sp. GGI-221]
MAGMSRDSATVELGAEPEFNYGDKVRSRKHVKNDG